MPFDLNVLKNLAVGLSEDHRHLVLRTGERRAEEAEYSLGIEEEYFLADAMTLDVAHTTPEELFEAINWSTGGQAMREMLQSQIEVVTNVHENIKDATEELRFLRTEAAKVADSFGLAIMASGTHPTALWRDSQLSPKRRYTDMIDDLRIVGRRNMLCGMHVHVRIPDPSRRVPLMRAMLPYIPLFIALSTSSPYWNSQATGLKGYRLAAYDEMPRTGLPELFSSEDEYRSYVQALQSSKVIPDESYIWWAMRPSMRHPTLELRAPDCCTLLSDAISIASLYRSLIRHLDRSFANLIPVTVIDRSIAIENKWRAQRYGIDSTFATKDGPMHVKDILDGLIGEIEEDSEALNSSAEVVKCRSIIQRGTSSDFQLFAASRDQQPLNGAKRWIARASIEDEVGVSRLSSPNAG